jgi:hypothetical protein
LRYHGVLPLKAGHHALLGEQRLNLDVSTGGVRAVYVSLWVSNAGLVVIPAAYKPELKPRKPTGTGSTLSAESGFFTIS